MQSSRFFRIALLLGLITAIGPFAIDMYLPALPSIGQALGADMATAQLSLTAFFLSMGAAQLVWGPISDMWGRKLPLYIGLSLFAAASVGCALAADIHWLIALRFVQGIGAAAAMAIPRAVVRDLHTGVDAARLMALLMLVFSVSPILAPLFGSGVIALAGWRAVFWVIAATALAALAMTAMLLDETRPLAARRQSSFSSALAGYAMLVRDRHYLGVVLIGACAISGFFAYLANSSFVLIGHWGLTPTIFSLLFSLNAAAFIGASQLTSTLARRLGLVRIVRLGVLGSSAFMLLLVAYFALGGDALFMLVALNFCSSAFIGLVIPSTAVLALDRHGTIAGTASALMGTLQMLSGVLAMTVLGQFADGRPLSMVIGMAAGTLAALAFAAGTLGLAGELPAAQTATVT